MICESCKYGADLRSRTKSPNDPVVIDAIREAHEDCPGDCGCQHRVNGKKVNRESASK